MKIDSKITAIVGGILSLIFDALSAVSGAVGIIGGICVNNNTPLAQKLMLVAAIFTLPMGFLFFFMFMIARKKAAEKWQECDS